MKKAENKPEDFIIPENSIDEKAETSEVEMNDEVLENISIADMMAQIDEKIAELDRMEKENEQEEEKIFASIKKVLEENQLEYSFHSESVKRIEILFVTENKPYSMQILFQNEKVVLRLVFPYRVQCNSLALVALYVAEFNQDKAFTLVNLNMSTGELSMEYAYYLSKAEKFDAESFEIYMNALLLLSNDMGQSEADNSVVQCYYASPEVIAAFIEIISAMNGTGSSVLLKRHAKSVSCPRKRDGVLRIGASITLHRDWDYDVDTIHDDTEVSLRAEMLKNMILSGADDRVLRSMLTSLFIWVDRWKRNGARLHIFGYDKDVYQVYGDKPEVFCHKTIQEQLEELARQIEDMSGEFCVNVFMEPDKYSEFAQSVGSIRSNPNVDLLKKVLDRTERHEGVTIAYCRSYKSMRSSMAYFPGYAPIRITAVGDMENLRCAMSDSTHLTGGEFNVPGRDAVKAYYYNKDTEKMGKVILYRPEIIL